MSLLTCLNIHGPMDGATLRSETAHWSSCYSAFGSKKEQNPDSAGHMHVLYRRAQARSPDELDSAGSLQAVFKPSLQTNTNTLHFSATL